MPRDAYVTIDGKAFDKNAKGVYRTITTPGEHTVEITQADSVGIAKTFKFRRGLKTNIKTTLSSLPKVESLETGGSFFYSDSNDDFYYLNGSKDTIMHGKYENGQLKTSAVTSKSLSNIDEIVWSPNKDLALLRKSDGKINMFDFKKYDFVNQTETFWGQNYGAIAWSPDNTEIAYTIANSDENSLFFSNIANTESTRILNLNDYNITNPLLRWSPDSSQLLIVSRATDVKNNKIYLLNVFNRTLSALAEADSYTNAIFSIDSKYVLTNKKSGETQRFSIENNKEQTMMKENLYLGNAFQAKDHPNIIYTGDVEGSIFGYDMIKNLRSGFILNKISDKKISVIKLMNGGKTLIYQNPDGIYKVEL